MTDPAQSPLPPGIPPGSIHLGSFNLAGKGPGAFMGGVVKLFSKPDEDLLDAATSFYKAADRCLNGNRVEPGIEMLTVPGAVCAAFACELFLKYIVLRETGKHPHGHKLDDLLKECSAECRDELAVKSPDIVQVLQRNSAHFVQARYHHEKDLFSFRQQELLQTAEVLFTFVRSRFFPEAPNKT
jgi:HEPN domain-containing protein